MLRLILVSLILSMSCSIAAADAPSRVWDVEYLAGDYLNPMVYSDEIFIRDQRDHVVKRCTSKQIETMLEVMNKIEAAGEISVRFYIVEGHKPNAFATYHEDEASVFVNFGMMDLIQADADQWGALLGHEVAHLKLEHSEKGRKRSLPLTVLRSAANMLTKTPAAQVAGQVLTTGISTKFSRDQERQSDYLGVIWAIEAGFDPYAAAALHREMSRQSFKLNIPFIFTHPSDKERIARLTELADRLGKKR